MEQYDRKVPKMVLPQSGKKLFVNMFDDHSQNSKHSRVLLPCYLKQVYNSANWPISVLLNYIFSMVSSTPLYSFAYTKLCFWHKLCIIQPVDNVIYVFKNWTDPAVLHSESYYNFITLLCSYMFIHYSFGYIILNGEKIKVKWWQNLNLRCYTSGTQMKITHVLHNAGSCGTWCSQWVIISTRIYSYHAGTPQERHNHC